VAPAPSTSLAAALRPLSSFWIFLRAESVMILISSFWSLSRRASSLSSISRVR